MDLKNTCVGVLRQRKEEEKLKDWEQVKLVLDPFFFHFLP